VSELSELLELLHGTGEPFGALHARFRVWSHRERAHAAFVAAAERRGGKLLTFRGDGRSRDPESVEVVEVWRAGPDRARVEIRGGDRDNHYGVRVGDRWWQFDPRSGARSNTDDASVGSSVGHELDVLLAPSQLLGPLRFAAVGRSVRVARAVLVADAWPRPVRRAGQSALFTLGEMGTGAERYRLEFDVDCGIVLAAQAFAAGKPFRAIEAVEFAVDGELDEDLFVFQAPEGEEIQGAGHHPPVLHQASIPEAQAAAPFTVLVPERVPPTWKIHCTYTGPSERPPSPPSVSINYRSDSGHESLNLILTPAAAQPAPINTDSWREVRAGDHTARVNGRGELGPQSQLQLEHAGTRVLMLSDTLTAEQLIALASMLTPAPTASNLD
jgi:hypothetical protein